MAHYKPAPRWKNISHPNALGINGITPGRKIVRVTPDRKECKLFTVMGYPYIGVLRDMSTGRLRNTNIVRLRDVYGFDWIYGLEELGVIPWNAGHRQGWARRHFVVDHRRAHLVERLDPAGLIPLL